MIAAEISNLQSLCHAHHSALQWSRGVIAAEMQRLAMLEEKKYTELQWSRGVIAAEMPIGRWRASR